MKATTYADYRARIDRARRHIEGRLDEALCLEDLARISGFSPFHFHRIFKGMVGEPLKAHVRRLRLERAAARLRLTRQPVTRIAFDAGYETHESFSRAFKQRFRISPSGYRQRHAGVEMPTPERAASAPAAPLDVRIIEIAPIEVAYMRHVGPYDTVGAAFAELLSLVDGAQTWPPRVVGVSYDDLEITHPSQVRFDVCVEVRPDAEIPDPARRRTLEGGRCAVLRHEGPYAALHQSYQALLGGWFPRSGYEPSSAGCLELYLNDPETTPTRALQTDICVPLA